MKRQRRKARLRRERERARVVQAKEQARLEAEAVLAGLAGEVATTNNYVQWEGGKCRRCREPLPVGDYCSFECVLESNWNAGKILFWGVDDLPMLPGRRSRIPLRRIRRDKARKRARSKLKPRWRLRSPLVPRRKVY